MEQGAGQEELEADLVFGGLVWSEDLVVDQSLADGDDRIGSADAFFGVTRLTASGGIWS